LFISLPYDFAHATLAELGSDPVMRAIVCGGGTAKPFMAVRVLIDSFAA
jgi:hypothetical protein